jgi:hypothetical protein
VLVTVLRIPDAYFARVRFGGKLYPAGRLETPDYKLARRKLADFKKRPRAHPTPPKARSMIVAFGYMGVADSGTPLNEILGDRRLQV